MTTISAITQDQKLIPTDTPTVAAGDKKTVQLSVDFDSAWNGLTKSAVFFTSTNNKTYEVIMLGNTCIVPMEVLVDKCHLFMGVRGIDNSGAVKTSTLIKYKIESGTPVGNASPVEPTPDVYQQILSAYGIMQTKSDTLENSVKNIAFSTLVKKAKELEPYTDLNTITETGIYYLSNTATWINAPNSRVTNSYLLAFALNNKRCTQILLPGNDTAMYFRSTYIDNTLWTNWKSNNIDIEIKNCFCKNIASDGTFEGYGYNYCYYNKSTKTGILYFASRIETPDSTLNNFSGYYDVESVLEKMSIDFNTILESNYIPYDSAGVVRQKLVGYGTTLLYSPSNKHYAFARYYTKDGKKGAWATTEFKKDDYITGSLMFN